MTASSAMAEADSACYAAKSAGRGRYHFFNNNDAVIVEVQQSQNWFQKIKDGLENDQFLIFLQKIVDANKNLVGFESLLRFRDNDTIQSPFLFMEHARRNGQLPKLDRFVVSTVLDQICDLQAKGSIWDGFYISANLSAVSVGDSEFRDWLVASLQERPEACRHLWIEITESDYIPWSGEEMTLLKNLQEMGVHLYLDDFGTGYNSFDMIKRIPVDGIKIDHSVTRGVLDNPIDQALISSSIYIARTKNLTLVAEGVEDADTFEHLTRLGASKFQGFFFHKPEFAEAALAELQQRPAAMNE
jgi:EAL domain-containing protein (putative c-di-GMP-specific phosphodiesterase class I)